MARRMAYFLCLAPMLLMHIGSVKASLEDLASMEDLGYSEDAADLLMELPAVASDATATYGGKTYILHMSTLVPFANAKAACESSLKDGHLVYIEDSGEQEFMHSLMNAAGATNAKAWIGLVDMFEEGDFKLLDGTSPSFTHWAPGQPDNNGDQDCVAIFQFLDNEWVDADCSKGYGYICEGKNPLYEGTCSGRCTDQGSDEECSCKKSCVEKGICCDDYEQECGGFETPPPSTSPNVPKTGPPTITPLPPNPYTPAPGPNPTPRPVTPSPSAVKINTPSPSVVKINTPSPSAVKVYTPAPSTASSTPAPSTSSNTPAPTSAIFSEVYEGHTYLVITKPASYLAAEAFCTQHGGHVVHVDDDGEDAFVSKALGDGNAPGDEAWLGLTEIGDIWQWSDGDQMTYSNWAPGQPDPDHLELCASTSKSTGLWDDVTCASLLPFVCEIPSAAVVPPEDEELEFEATEEPLEATETPTSEPTAAFETFDVTNLKLKMNARKMGDGVRLTDNNPDRIGWAELPSGITKDLGLGWNNVRISFDLSMGLSFRNETQDDDADSSYAPTAELFAAEEDGRGLTSDLASGLGLPPRQLNVGDEECDGFGFSMQFGETVNDIRFQDKLEDPGIGFFMVTQNDDVHNPGVSAFYDKQYQAFVGGSTLFTNQYVRVDVTLSSEAGNIFMSLKVNNVPVFGGVGGFKASQLTGKEHLFFVGATTNCHHTTYISNIQISTDRDLTERQETLLKDYLMYDAVSQRVDDEAETEPIPAKPVNLPPPSSVKGILHQFSEQVVYGVHRIGIAGFGIVCLLVATLMMVRAQWARHSEEYIPL